MTNPTNPTPWKEAVIYQIYPRSFKDSNGDGIGDINGIIEKLDYIQSLGVDIIWLSPFFKSPMDDMGYDVSDYRDIDPIFGTMKDFENLVAESDKRGFIIMMDMVMNHCSDEHFWFTEACKSVDNPYHDYFIWTDKPNNWVSLFSGSAWEYVPSVGKYYLHVFSQKQPDLNWENPKLRHEMKDIIRFWLDKGVKAIRFDAITSISKPYGFPNAPDNLGLTDFISFGPHLAEWLEEINQEVFAEYDVITVGEGPAIVDDEITTITGDDKCLQTLHVFNAHGQDIRGGVLFKAWPFDVAQWQKDSQNWAQDCDRLGIWNTSVIQNHDLPRIVSRFGNDAEYWQQSASLWAVWNLTQKAAIYVYQGEELGMRNHEFTSFDEYKDVQVLNFAKEVAAKGENLADYWNDINYRARDNARTPMQWDKTQPYYGFSAHKPWINGNEDGIDAMTSPIIDIYKQLIILRKQYKDILVYGDIVFDENKGDAIISYKRIGKDKTWQILLNFSDETKAYPISYGKIIYNNYDQLSQEQLQPWQAVIIEL